MKIRRDKHGLYIRSRWWGIDKTADAYRPGTFRGWSSPGWPTDDAGLKEGDNPKTAHVAEAPFIRIRLEDGREVFWGSYGRTEGDFPETR